MNATHALETGGGVHLATERWVPPREVRAHVVFVHGLGEHRRALPYVPFYEKLATSGYAVLAFDLRGHGESDPAADGDYTRQAFTDDHGPAMPRLGQGKSSQTDGKRTTDGPWSPRLSFRAQRGISGNQ